MSKTISFKGQLDMGTQEQIRLKTNQGKTGYKISKFQLFPKEAHTNDIALVAQIFQTDQTGSITGVVNFSEGNLIAVASYEDKASSNYPTHETIIFDNQIVNQDIFVTMVDTDGNTTPANFYLELETMSLTDIQSTQLTLQSLRNVVSR